MSVISWFVSALRRFLSMFQTSMNAKIVYTTAMNMQTAQILLDRFLVLVKLATLEMDLFAMVCLVNSERIFYHVCY